MLEQIVDRTAALLNYSKNAAKPVVLPSDSRIIRHRISEVLLSQGSIGLLPSFKRVRWEYLAAVLELCDGNISEVARRTGTPRRTIQRILTNKRAPAR